MPVTDSYHENSAIFCYPIDDQVRFEGMNSDRRYNLHSFASNAGIIGDQIQQMKKFIVVATGLRCSEYAHTLLGDRDDVLFRLDR